jgi:hypothetical protein
MEEKVCFKCKISQPKENFGLNKTTKDGLTTYCKLCLKDIQKDHNNKPIVKLKSSAKRRGMSLEDVIEEENLINEAKRLNMKYCYDCSRILEKTCFGKLKIASDGLNTTCKECRIKVSRKYYKNNSESVAKQKRQYTIDNWEYINKRQIKYVKKRMEIDESFRLTTNLRRRVKTYLKLIGIMGKISKSTYEMIGCTPQELRDYIESKFVDGMSWDNYGLRGWHIDHIIPLSSTKIKEEIIKLNHYTNLQPLWATDNLKKGSKIL